MGFLRYDVITDQTPEYDAAAVVLKGNGTTLIYDISNPVPGQWTTVSVNLLPNANWHLNSLTGAAPAAAEFHNGVTEPSGLVNVSLSAAPEPSTRGLVVPVFGMAACGWLRRRYYR